MAKKRVVEIPAAMIGLRVRKLADKSQGPRFCPKTGKQLPWPCAGLQIDDGQGNALPPPQRTSVPRTFVERLKADGLLELEGERVVTAPGGPVEDRHRVTHTFRQADAFVLRCATGDVRYRVTRNPGKYYAADGLPVTEDLSRFGEPAYVWWDYQLELVES